jgi:hypothetical protein
MTTDLSKCFVAELNDAGSWSEKDLHELAVAHPEGVVLAGTTEVVWANDKYGNVGETKGGVVRGKIHRARKALGLAKAGTPRGEGSKGNGSPSKFSAEVSESGETVTLKRGGDSVVVSISNSPNGLFTGNPSPLLSFRKVLDTAGREGLAKALETASETVGGLAVDNSWHVLLDGKDYSSTKETQELAKSDLTFKIVSEHGTDLIWLSNNLVLLGNIIPARNAGGKLAEFIAKIPAMPVKVETPAVTPTPATETPPATPTAEIKKNGK